MQTADFFRGQNTDPPQGHQLEGPPPGHPALLNLLGLLLRQPVLELPGRLVDDVDRAVDVEGVDEPGDPLLAGNLRADDQVLRLVFGLALQHQLALLEELPHADFCEVDTLVVDLQELVVVGVDQQVHLLPRPQGDVERLARRALPSLNRRVGHGPVVAAPSQRLLLELHSLREVYLEGALGREGQLLQLEPRVLVVLPDDGRGVFCDFEPECLILVVEYPDIGLEYVVVGCDFAVDDGVVLANLDALYLLTGDVLGVLVELQLELVAE